jgi:TRAP-type C4-dicarboxylate transport system substrate-binding protein
MPGVRDVLSGVRVARTLIRYRTGLPLHAAPGPAREAAARAGRGTEVRHFAAFGIRLAENEARMRANGVEVASAPAELRAVLARAAEPVVAEWAARAGAEGEAILAAYRTR